MRIQNLFDRLINQPIVDESVLNIGVYCLNGGNVEDCNVEIDNIYSNGSYTVNVALIKIENSRTFPFVLFQNAFNFNIETKKSTTHVQVRLTTN